MGIHKNARNIINEMLYEIASNQNICKYVVYDDPTIDPLTQADIADPTQYIYQSGNPTAGTFRFFPIPKMPAVENNKVTFIVCWVKKFSRLSDSNNIYFKDFVLCFDVLSHIDIWAIKGGKERPLEIMDEINNIFALKYSTNSTRRITPLDDSYVSMSNNLFCGYHLEYMATGFNSDYLCR